MLFFFFTLLLVTRIVQITQYLFSILSLLLLLFIVSKINTPIHEIVLYYICQHIYSFKNY